MNCSLFWTFFILFLCLSKISCSMCDDLSIDGTEADTGYPSCVIDYIYIRYYRVMFPGDPLRTKPNLPYNATYEEIHFYLLLVYIHLYPDEKLRIPNKLLYFNDAGQHPPSSIIYLLRFARC